MDSDEERNWVYCGMIKLLGSFLKEKRDDICLYIGFIGVFYVIFSLSNLPVDAVNYAFFLSAIWLLGYGIFKFNQYYKKGVAVIEAKQRLEEVMENLPATRSYIELEYQAIIQNMYKKMSDLQSAERIGRQEMKDYYSMWAHQIKTPIAALRLLLAEEEDERSQEMWEELFSIEQYVEMALQFSRLSAKSTDFVIGEVSLDKVVREAIHKYARLFVRKKIKMELSSIDTQVLTDEKWLEFVIEQILSNAIKYTAGGTISVYLEEESEQETKELVIEDTGIGIAPEDLPRIFEKGYTGYNGHADKHSTGIGLYLCRKIMRKLSHEITIESEIGVGTKVHLEIR